MATQYVDIVNGSDTFQTVSITAATRANPCVITSNTHGLSNGQWIRITGVVGMTQLNANVYKIANVAANTFELQDTSGNNINSSAFGVYTSGGTATIWRKMIITGITQANPAVVTAKKHGFSNGNIVIIENVAGMTEVNDVAFTVANATTDTFELSGINSSGYGAYTSGGTVTRPFLLMNTLQASYAATTNPQNSFYMQGDTVKFAKTFSYDGSITVGSGNITFTRNSFTVTTSVDLRASISVGDYIGLTTATLNGWDTTGSPARPEIFYKVTATAAGSITLQVRYGGTTTTVSSIYRLRSGTEIRVTGAASTNAITTNSTGITFEGGYSFNGAGAITRDGTTAYKPVTSGDFYGWSSADVSCTWRYFGFLDAGRCFVMGATSNNNLVEYCSVNPSIYYGFVSSSTVGGTILRYCWGTGANSSSSELFITQTGPGQLIDSCYTITTQIRGIFSSAPGAIVIQNCLAECSPLGIETASATNPIIYNSSANLCTVGMKMSASSKIVGGSIDGCATGITTTAPGNSYYIKGTTISNSTTTGITAPQAFGITLEDVTFVANVVDVTQDQYTNNLKLINCSSTTPTNWHISRALNTAPTTCLGCTIDAPSVAKAIQIVTGNNYDNAAYYVQNSYGIPSGAYYANGQYVEDSTEVKTSGYSMKLQYNSTVSGTTLPYKMASYYVAGGTAKTFTFYIKRDAATWTGTITPQLRLNGKLIKTESNITSLNNDWTTAYTASATSGQISTDGELSLEFIYNANNTAIWIDDVTIA